MCQTNWRDHLIDICQAIPQPTSAGRIGIAGQPRPGRLVARSSAWRVDSVNKSTRSTAAPPRHQASHQDQGRGSSSMGGIPGGGDYSRPAGCFVTLRRLRWADRFLKARRDGAHRVPRQRHLEPAIPVDQTPAYMEVGKLTRHCRTDRHHRRLGQAFNRRRPTNLEPKLLAKVELFWRCPATMPSYRQCPARDRGLLGIWTVISHCPFAGSPEAQRRRDPRRATQLSRRPGLARERPTRQRYVH